MTAVRRTLYVRCTAYTVRRTVFNVRFYSISLYVLYTLLNVTWDVRIEVMYSLRRFSWILCLVSIELAYFQIARSLFIYPLLYLRIKIQCLSQVTIDVEWYLDIYYHLFILLCGSSSRHVPRVCEHTPFACTFHLHSSFLIVIGLRFY